MEQETAEGREAALASKRSATLAGIGSATERLLAAIATLTDAQAREPSLLPGWTRGHVLTHLARNADGLANALRSARTGTELPMYASGTSRDADIEAGAGRPAAGLVADVRESTAAFAREAALMPAGAWAARVRRIPGGEQFPAWDILPRRLGEVEIHHADLGLGYQPRDWPAEFAATQLPRVTRSRAGDTGAPPCLINPAGTEDLLPIGPARPQAAGLTVHGSAADLLAWLTGRSDGAGLRVTPPGEPLPVLPTWR